MRGVKAWLVVRRLLVTALVGLLIGGGIWLLSGKGGEPAATERSGSTGGESPEPAPEPEPEPEPVEPAFEPPACPPDLTNCESATGRIIYVEKVDPDGDGDAHFVTASGEGITGPGITIFDVRTDLRPDPLPGVGDLVGGAGPVYPGSRGQKQIEVVEFEVAE